MTDVTGFGLLGHLTEMCEGARLSAIIHADRIPVLNEAAIYMYLEKGSVPGGTHRNWKSYGHKISPIENDALRFLLADPQTSGGLLVAVAAEGVHDFQEQARKNGFELEPIGQMVAPEEFRVRVKK